MSRRVVDNLFALLVMGVASLVLSQGLFSSHEQHAGTKHAVTVLAQSNADPPGTIDGAKNPELISDFKAYEVFFHAVAVADNASQAEVLSAKNKFRRAHLSEADAAELLKILEEFHKQRSDIIARAEQLSRDKAPDSEYAKLQQREGEIIAAARQSLQSRLSPDGAEKMRQHIMGLKSKIKIIPGSAK